MFRGIDFFSDTVTRPSKEMRLYMANAEVGDEQLDEDPTTKALEKQVATLLGTETAVFFPTASMANEVALRAMSRPGDELVCYEHCHLCFAETGGPAIHSGLMIRPIRSEDGTFSGADVRQMFRDQSGPHFPDTKIVSVENTTNMGGGVPWPMERLEDVSRVARELNLSLHMDGARLWNAAVAENYDLKKLGQWFDMITVCFSKGLGCPAGAVLALPHRFEPSVKRLKQLFGGSLRQSGILAAAGLFALEHHFPKLSEDHQKATQLAKGLSSIRHLEMERLPSTNIFYFKWLHPSKPSSWLLSELEKRGVRFSEVALNRIRAVTHRDISMSDIDQAIHTVKTLLEDAS